MDSCPIFDSLESFDCEPYRGRVDLVVAGFPCQGASVAGKRLGVDDERWLWREVWRIARGVGAAWLFVENVTGLLSVNGGAAFEEILGDLAALGWSACWDCVPAGAIGAPHLRDRVFLLAADANRVGVRFESERDQRQGRGARAPERGDGVAVDSSSARHATDSDGGGRGTGRSPVRQGEPNASRSGDRDATDADRDGSPLGTKRTRRRSRRRDKIDEAGVRGREAADADHEAERPPLGAQPTDDARRGAADAPVGREAAAYAASIGRDEGGQIDLGSRWQGGADAAGGDQSPSSARSHPNPDRAGLETQRDSGEQGGMDGEQAHRSDADRRRGPWDRHLDILERGGEHWSWERAPEPTVRGVDDGAAAGMGADSYADELHLLGNGVVPHAAAFAFSLLWDRLHGTALAADSEG